MEGNDVSMANRKQAAHAIVDLVIVFTFIFSLSFSLSLSISQSLSLFFYLPPQTIKTTFDQSFKNQGKKPIFSSVFLL